VEYSGLIIGIIIATYLAIDAPKQNMRPVLWAIVGFLFGPIGLGIYLIQTLVGLSPLSLAWCTYSL
jgi:hypothetical protein